MSFIGRAFIALVLFGIYMGALVVCANIESGGVTKADAYYTFLVALFGLLWIIWG